MQMSLPDVDVGTLRERVRTELVLIFLGGTSCGSCRDPALKVVLAEVRARLSRLITGTRIGFKSIGVAIDWEVDQGVTYLTDQGTWDELSVGSNFRNSLFNEHCWVVPGTRAAIPQLILLERKYRMGSTRIEVLGKRYLARVIGVGAIANWVESGMSVQEALVHE